MFKVYGHNNVSVLNGGLSKWIKEGKPTTSDPNVGTEEDYKVTLNADLLKTYEQITSLEVEFANGKNDIQIFDARGEA